jgi:hypothetical protein
MNYTFERVGRPTMFCAGQQPTVFTEELENRFTVNENIVLMDNVPCASLAYPTQCGPFEPAITITTIDGGVIAHGLCLEDYDEFMIKLICAGYFLVGRAA